MVCDEVGDVLHMPVSLRAADEVAKLRGTHQSRGTKDRSAAFRCRNSAAMTDMQIEIYALATTLLVVTVVAYAVMYAGA